MNTRPISIRVPFSGTYFPFWDDTYEAELSLEAEHLVESDARFSDTDIAEVKEALCDVIKWHVVRETTARVYAEKFGDWIRTELEMSEEEFAWKFEELYLPREYNFETDRIYVITTDCVIARLFRVTDASILQKTIKEEHSDRPGFFSLYSNELLVWLETPVEKWDHNQLHTLLLAWMRTIGEEVQKNEQYFMEEMGEVIHNAMDYDVDKVYASLTRTLLAETA